MVVALGGQEQKISVDPFFSETFTPATYRELRAYWLYVELLKESRVFLNVGFMLSEMLKAIQNSEPSGSDAEQAAADLQTLTSAILALNTPQSPGYDQLDWVIARKWQDISHKRDNRLPSLEQMHSLLGLRPYQFVFDGTDSPYVQDLDPKTNLPTSAPPNGSGSYVVRIEERLERGEQIRGQFYLYHDPRRSPQELLDIATTLFSTLNPSYLSNKEITLYCRKLIGLSSSGKPLFEQGSMIITSNGLIYPSADSVSGSGAGSLPGAEPEAGRGSMSTTELRMRANYARQRRVLLAMSTQGEARMREIETVLYGQGKGGESHEGATSFLRSDGSLDRIKSHANEALHRLALQIPIIVLPEQAQLRKLKVSNQWFYQLADKLASMFDPRLSTVGSEVEWDEQKSQLVIGSEFQIEFLKALVDVERAVRQVYDKVLELSKSTDSRGRTLFLNALSQTFETPVTSDGVTVHALTPNRAEITYWRFVNLRKSVLDWDTFFFASEDD